MKLVRYEDWAVPGLRHPGSKKMALPSGRVFIHHAAGPSPINEAAEVRLLREYDAQHRRKGWNGIGYSFIVGPSGTVYEGRGDRVGAHTEGMNSKGFGVCFLGNFMTAVPTSAAMIAASQLMQHLIKVGALRSDFRLTGHRDHVATACPGNYLYRDLPKLRAMVNRPAPAPEENPVSDTSAPAPSHKVNAPPVGIAVTPTGAGYFILCADGGVFGFGDAAYLGRVEELAPGAWDRYFGITA